MAPLYLVCGPDCANSDKCRIFVADGVFNRSHARSCCGLVPRPCVPFWRKGGIRGWPDSALRAHFCASGAFCGQKRIDGSADHIRAGLFYTRLAFQPRLDKFASRFSVYLPRRLELAGIYAFALPLIASFFFLIWRANLGRSSRADAIFGFGLLLALLGVWLGLVILKGTDATYLNYPFCQCLAKPVASACRLVAGGTDCRCRPIPLDIACHLRILGKSNENLGQKPFRFTS